MEYTQWMDRSSNYKFLYKKPILAQPYLRRVAISLCVLVSLRVNVSAQQNIRTDISLNNNWFTIATADDKLLPANSYNSSIDKNWVPVNVPHNWDSYEGYRRLLHGNRHGDSWYRKIFSVSQSKKKKRFFLFFEGVSSYATVFLNGRKVGEHTGGRTTFTLDVSDIIKTDGSKNQLAVRAWHPADIKDLPWVCGACSDERGFSEGSQPMGIFRPVHLIVTSDIRIQPFGVHAWAEIENDKTNLSVKVTVKNYSALAKNISVINQLLDAQGKIVAQVSGKQLLKANDSITVLQNHIAVEKPHLWSVENPYLYKIVSIIKENNQLIDKTETEFGFRTINWKTASHQFLLNGQPVFINGIAEYEHQLGQSGAFSNEQILSRINWLKAAGFNAFRDAHQPHNLLYGDLCEKEGILWWTQLSAHIWYDSPAFRNNFKQLLKEWVTERRNNPAVILWGLQNESKLPEDFARECTALIRELDPTTSSQRLVTTCNGGAGTDWDVPQNWTGTYGGDPNIYASDIKKQVLIGEYGAWRTIDLHTEGGFAQNGPLSEDRMTQLMETKLRLAESVRDSCAGQFFWLLTSHDNPGRVQGGEGLRELDRIGPVNYKGMLTPWEEPTDAFYMFRSNYAPAAASPMVYIVSHTWPNRWMVPGVKDSIIVYSNCDEVELFNDMNAVSLGKRKKNGIGTHFQWDGADIQYNVLYAVGYLKGKAVAKDTIVLNHLPASPNFNKLYQGAKNITRPAAGYQYVYRINCGGGDYIDENKNVWLADRSSEWSMVNSKSAGEKSMVNSESITHHQTNKIATTNAIEYSPFTIHQWGSSSWTTDFPGLPAFFASQRRTFSPVKGTKDWPLFQDFRYGKDKLKYEFLLADGEYLVELYFIEPWLGIGGGMNAEKMRLFDVTINDKIVLHNLDIWKEAGVNTALKKTIKVKTGGGKMVISFPQSKTGQAVISAIAIASLKNNIKPLPDDLLIKDLSCKNCKEQSWLDIGQKQYADASSTFNSLPPNLYGANWLQFVKNGGSEVSFIVTTDADIFIGFKDGSNTPAWLKEYENSRTQIVTDEDGGTNYAVFRKRFSKGRPVKLFADQNFIVMYLPVTNMQPAYDLKAVTAFRANVAVISEAAKKENFAGRECVVVKSDQPATVEWPVQTGVGDVYSITLKYYYPAEKELKAKVQLIGPGNTLMVDEPVNFTFTRPGKWNTITFNTRTMINAGNYIVRLMTENAEGLAISGIEVQ